MRKKTLIGLLCIVTALATTFLVAPLVSPAGNSPGEAISVLRMKQTVESGTPLTAELVVTVNVDKGTAPKTALTDLSQIGTAYATSRLYAGDILTSEKLTDGKTTSAIAAGTAKGYRVISVTISTLAAGVSGKLQPGDIVTVLTLPKTVVSQGSLGTDPTQTIDTSQDAESSAAQKPVRTVIYPEMKAIEVCAVSAADGSDARVNSVTDDKQKNTLPVTVSLYATDEQAARLVELEQTGGIHLAFVARGADAGKFIPDAQRVLSEVLK